MNSTSWREGGMELRIFKGKSTEFGCESIFWMMQEVTVPKDSFYSFGGEDILGKNLMYCLRC